MSVGDSGSHEDVREFHRALWSVGQRDGSFRARAAGKLVVRRR